MKKTIYSIAAFGLALFASCSEDMLEKNTQQQNSNEISFAIAKTLESRGVPVTTDNLFTNVTYSEMQVVAFEGGNYTTPYFSDNLSLNEEGVLETELTHYWPASGGALDFFVKPNSEGISDESFASGSYTFHYEAPVANAEEAKDGENTEDLVFAYATESEGTVELQFEHAMAQVKFVYADPIIGHQIPKIEIVGAYTEGDCTFSGNVFAWDNQDGSATLTQTFDEEEGEVHVVGQKIGTEVATFMLIPGAEDSTNKLTFKVYVDDKDPLSLEYDYKNLEPGQTLTVNIKDGTDVLVASNENVGAHKKYVDNGNGTYDLFLETWVEGEATPTPADIAILVDVSGSMRYGYSIETEPTNGPFTYNGFTDDTYFYIDNNGRYCPVRKGSRTQGWNTYYRLEYYSGGDWYRLGDEKTNKNNTLYNQPLYKGVSRMQATQEALNTFISKISENAGANKIHKVSLVTFATNASNKTNPVWTNDYNKVLTAINNLAPGGSTYAESGVSQVKTNFNNNLVKDDGAEKIMVMLTDGDPTHSSGFEGSVANKAIEYANDLKKDDVTIWTIYVGPEISENSYKYMTHVSSDYGYKETTPTYNDNLEPDFVEKYYTLAQNPEDLNKVFNSVAGDLGGLGSSTVIKDILSSSFTLPEGVSNSDLEFYTCNWMSGTGGDIQWETQGGKEVWHPKSGQSSWNPTDKVIGSADDALNSVGRSSEDDANSKTLNITGFAYDKYFCGGTEGKKLIIRVKGLTLADKENGTYLTNGYGSGIVVNGQVVSPFVDDSGKGGSITISTGN